MGCRLRKTYVVKRTENRYGCTSSRSTWDVLKASRDGFEHVAECVQRNHAIVLARALNKGIVR